MFKPSAKILALITPKRRWTQFSLGTMFLVVTALCVWLAVQVDRANRQRDAVRRIRELRGHVVYAHKSANGRGDGPQIPNRRPPGPDWLRNLLGEDYFVTVSGVSLIDEPTTATDADLVVLEQLPSLKCIDIGGKRFTDAGFRHIAPLHQLRVIRVIESSFGDGGLACLCESSSVEMLCVSNTKVTNAGLKHVAHLKSLKFLDLCGTGVSDNGLVHLQGLDKLEILQLSGPDITDAGLDYLIGLTSLRSLHLPKTKLRYLSVENTQVTDAGLVHLEKLTALENLNLKKTRVSDAGVLALQKALPKCAISR